MSREQFCVLILDDDELFCRTLADSLRRNQDLCFVVETATTEAIARQLVSAAAQPFDVFLIDQRLGAGKDGIDILRELRQLSPTTEAIVFTGLDDHDAGMRAYQAGAYRYLIKPFDTHELVWILRSLRKWQDTQYERDWLEVLTAVAQDAQRALSMQEVAAIVVQGGRRLGFERARLWLLSENQETLTGASQMGHDELSDFTSFRMLVSEATYLRLAIQQREPSFFQGPEHGEGYMQRQAGQQGFKLPIGEWLILPLWAADRCLGALTLDNASQDRPLRPEQRRLLSLFGRQVAAALERARLYELEERKNKGLEVLNEIGRRVTASAAQTSLDQLLHEVHAQVGRFMDVRNFKVVLLNRETGQLDFRLHIEAGQTKPPYRWRRPAGLVWHLISRNAPLLLPHGEEHYIKEHHLRRLGNLSRSWLGVPLRVGNAAEGCIIVWSREHEQAYDEDDQRVLMAVADQVAGVIQTAHLKEREEQDRQQLAMLNRASAEMMRLAEENEDWLWHMILTAATASYGLRFNRVILLLAEQGGAYLRGRLGIGHFEIDKAHRAWREDQAISFEDYLQQLHDGTLDPTPVELFMRQDWGLDLSNDSGALSMALNEGRGRRVPAAHAARQLPAAFVQRFGVTDYAVLPLRAGTKMLGLVLVDNIHNKEPLRDTALHQLETLLAQATLTWETLRQRRARDKLIELNYTIMAELSNRPLKETLTQVCQVAQAVLGSDAATIYVLKPEREPYEFDMSHTTAIGQKTQSYLHSVPRPKGITSHILRAGPLIVQDIIHDRALYGGLRLAEHPFHQAEQFRTMIGLPLRDRSTGAPLGVMYLNSRTPQTVSEQDIRQAESFASLAALAIRNTWEAQRTHRALAVVEAERQQRERELNILHRVLAEALAADTGEEKVIRALLNAAQELLGHPNAQVQLQLQLLDQEKPEQPAGHQAVCRSRLTMPIMLGAQIIGRFAITSPDADAFAADHERMLERLAAAAALALDNVRRQKHLYTVLKAAQTVMTPLGLHETLNAVLEAVRATAPGLSALTIWYREPESARIVLGPYFGILHEDGMRRREPSEHSVVRTVMQLTEPLWAPVAKDEPRLIGPEGRFIAHENIASTAALPLRADDEVVGAIFLNYRQRHDFTVEEQALFPILAAIAAASVRDAARLDVTRKQQHRLEAALKITSAVGATLDLDEILRQIMATLRSLFAHTAPSLLTLTYNAAERILEFTPASREFYPIDVPGYADWTQLPLDGPSIASQLARRSLSSKQVEVINIGDVSQEPAYLPLNSSTRSELCLTLMSGERLLGVLAMESPQPDAFSDDDSALVRGIGQQIGIALDRAYQNAQLQFKTTIAATTAWAGEIAHDINREVGYIRNRAYWLREDYTISRDGRQYAQEIDQSAARLAGALGAAGHWNLQEYECLQVDDWLKRWVGEMVADRCSNVRVQYEPGCTNLEIRTHPGALQRALQHLMRNALEAMQYDGRLTVRTCRVDDEQIEIQIEDNGPGVPEQLRPLLFQQPVTTRGKEGGGLGLLFVRSTIEAVGGSVHLLPTRYGPGSIFAVKLPRKQDLAGKEC